MPRFHAPVPVVIAALLLGAGAPLAISQSQESQPDRETRRAALLERAAAERAVAARDQDSQAIAQREAEVAAERAAGHFGPTISLDFRGGTLADYLAHLKDAAGSEPTNILMRGDADAIDVGPAQLRDVSLFSALQLVSGGYLGADGREHHVSTRNLPAQGDSAAAFLVEVVSERQSGSLASGPRDVLVLSIKEMTTPLPGDPPEVVVPAETILTAIETAISVAGDENVTSEIKFHPESGLIILAGTGNVLRAADRVVQQIWSDVEERRGRAREIQKIQGLANPESLEEQLADYRTSADLARVQAENADQQRRMREERLDELRALAEQGGVSRDELRKAEMEYSEAKAKVAEQMIMADRAMQRAGRAEEALARARAIAAGGGAGSELAALREENAMLRDRLAMMEAQLTELRARLEDQSRGGGTR